MIDRHVLIVEDKRALADLYGRWLEDSYAVHTAYDGREALDALDERVDVVLLDRRLPDISGDEVLQVIRDRGLDCRVAMITAVEPNFDVVSLGFDDYLTKPVSEDDLRETVEELLRRSEYDDAMQEYFAVLSTQSTLEDAILSGEVGDREVVREADRPDVDMDQVDGHALPSVVAELADEYEAAIGHRDRFLLKWLHAVFPFFSLSSVDDDYRERARADKTLASMFVMLLDDIGEYHRDTATLAEVAKLPFPHESIDRDAPDIDIDYVNVTESVWETLESRIREAPRYDEIEPLLRYDIRQVIHAIRYSCLVNDRPYAANMAESQALGAHNMMMLTYADIDIAYSSAFRLSDLGTLRSLILELQQMARIGNWITTWERELDEGDYSAGVFVSALENGIISVADLQEATDDSAARDRVARTIRQAGVEEALLEQWHERYERLRADPPAIESMDVEDLLEGMERVMAYHLASRGLK